MIWPHFSCSGQGGSRGGPGGSRGQGEGQGAPGEGQGDPGAKGRPLAQEVFLGPNLDH